MTKQDIQLLAAAVAIAVTNKQDSAAVITEDGTRIDIDMGKFVTKEQ